MYLLLLFIIIIINYQTVTSTTPGTDWDPTEFYSPHLQQHLGVGQHTLMCQTSYIVSNTTFARAPVCSPMF